MPTQQDILNNLSQYYSSQGKTVAPTVEAISRYNAPAIPALPLIPAPPVPPIVDRTAGVGKLGTSQEDLASAYSAETMAKARQEADLYASNQRQARIDAINATFAPRMEATQKAGQEQLSRVDAINFKRGIVGSGADTTKIGEQKGLNAKALQAVEQEKSMLINDAFNQADKLAVERAHLKTQQGKEAALANVNLYKEQADRAIATLQSFGSANTSLEDIKQADPKTYDTLKEVSGLSDFEINNMITAANPKNKILKTEVTSDGTVINIVQKPDGTVEVQRNKTDIKPDEKIQMADGVAYGAKTDTNGNLVLRKLTSKEGIPGIDNLSADDPIFFVTAGIKSELGKKNAVQKYTNMLNKGQTQEANRFIETLAFQNLGAPQKEDYGVYSDGERIIGNVLADTDKFKENNLSLYKTAIERAKPFVLLQKDQKWVDITSKIEQAQARIRKGFFGTALTGTEKASAEQFLINFDRDDIATAETKLRNMAELAGDIKKRLINEQKGIFTNESSESQRNIITAPDGQEIEIID